MKATAKFLKSPVTRSGPYVGGIGSGGFEVRADGTFPRCHVFNNWRSDTPMPIEFLKVDADGRRFLRLDDRSSPWGAQAGCSRSVIRDEFPFVNLEFPETGTSLEFWSPFVPGNLRDSALPAVFARVKAPGKLIMILRPPHEGVPVVGARSVIFEGAEGSIGLSTRRGFPFAFPEREGWRAWSAIAEGRRPRIPARWKKRRGKWTIGIWWDKADDEAALGWYYPRFRDHEGREVGHEYAGRFRSCRAVLNHVTARRSLLRAATERFTRSIYRANAPAFLKDALGMQLHAFVKESWLTRDGRFGVWEGSCSCCGLQTTDVAFYGSWLYAMLFPGLERAGLRLCSRFQRKSDGWIPHLFPGTLARIDEYRRKDMNMQFVLMAVRDWLLWDDVRFLREMYPAVKRAILGAYAWDTNGDGIPEVEGTAQTYDSWGFSGTTSYLTVLWLGALKAAARAARAVGDPRFAGRCEADVVRIRETLIRKLWNGRYFDLAVDGSKRDPCCMLDGLSGDWFCRLSGIGGVLPDKMVASHLRQAMKLCRKRIDPSYMRAYLTPGEKGWCYVNGGYLDGRHVCFQQYEPWTGTEYAYAVHLALMGRRGQALRVVKDVQDRKIACGMAWNHIECGGDYYRPMVIGALWDLLVRKALPLR